MPHAAWAWQPVPWLANTYVTFFCFPVQWALHRASPCCAAQTSLLPDAGWHHLIIRAVQRPSKVRESHSPPLPQPLCQQRRKTTVSGRVSSNLPQRSDTLPFYLHPLQTTGLLFPNRPEITSPLPPTARASCQRARSRGSATWRRAASATSRVCVGGGGREPP